MNNPILMPDIFVTKSSMPDREEYFNEIKELWDTHWLTNMGVKHQEFQNKLISFLNVDGLDLLTNGHMALELSLQALRLEGEVITTPFTFASTTHAIVRNGLIPVFCDINDIDYTIDTDKIENLITDKTTAIMPVHVYGNICNVERIQEIADKYCLKVIYDACHAFGETYKGANVARFGDVSVFSFHATKVFNSIEGGAVCFSDEEFGYTIARLKNFGIYDEETIDGIGLNAKMNEFCAAMGICNLRHLNREIEKRKSLVMHYRKRLADIPGIRLNFIHPEVKSNYSYFPILIIKKQFGMDRDGIKNYLDRHRIGTRKYFYPLTNAFECFYGIFDTNRTPVAKRISEEVLTLPLYADLTIEQVDYICDLIEECSGKRL